MEEHKARDIADSLSLKTAKVLLIFAAMVSLPILADQLINYRADIRLFGPKITLTDLVNAITSLHWYIWVCLSALIYPFFGAIANSVTAGSSRPASFIPAWSQLRSFGDQRLARASYAVVLLIPIAAYFVVEDPINVLHLGKMKLPLNVKLSYFSSLFFSLALLAYSVACPASFRRHEMASSNKEAPSRTIQLSELSDNDRLIARSVAFALYLIGIVLGIIVICRSALYVVEA